MTFGSSENRGCCMKKVGHTIYVWLWGSRRTVVRTLFEDNGHFYIRWYGNFIEVRQCDGFPNVSSGWSSIESY